MRTVTHRLDNFTDAAFAFAVTLVVIGNGAPTRTVPDLMRAITDIPAFAIGFVLLAMFWFAHVKWRKLRGEGDTVSVLLTIFLVFLVLLYVHPLRMTATGTSFALTGIRDESAQLTPEQFGLVWQVYGVGFAAMAATVSALFADAERNRELSERERVEARGNMYVYAILSATGAVSVSLASIGATIPAAPFAYATLPLTVGLFSWRFFSKRLKPEAEPA